MTWHFASSGNSANCTMMRYSRACDLKNQSTTVISLPAKVRVTVCFAASRKSGARVLNSCGLAMVKESGRCLALVQDKLYCWATLPFSKSSRGKEVMEWGKSCQSTISCLTWNILRIVFPSTTMNVLPCRTATHLLASSFCETSSSWLTSCNRLHHCCSRMQAANLVHTMAHGVVGPLKLFLVSV